MSNRAGLKYRGQGRIAPDRRPDASIKNPAGDPTMNLSGQWSITDGRILVVEYEGGSPHCISRSVPYNQRSSND
jgi:hypothetical protein